MSPAESIPYETICEVHPGAGSVKCDFLAGHGSSRYLYSRSMSILNGIQIEWNRVFHRLYIRGGFFCGIIFELSIKEHSEGYTLSGMQSRGIERWV